MASYKFQVARLQLQEGFYNNFFYLIKSERVVVYVSGCCCFFHKKTGDSEVENDIWLGEAKGGKDR